MNHLFTRSTSTVARDKPQQSDTRLHGKRLILARAACLAAGILSFGVFVASVPATYGVILSHYCTRPLCNHPTQASAQFVQQLQALGLSVQAYAIYYTIVNIFFVCTYFVIAIMLFWPPFPFNPYMNIIFTAIAFLVFVGAMVVAQVYRYLRVSNGVQRQQTKWVVFGVSIGIGGYLVFSLLFALFFPSASQSPLATILLNTFNHLLLLLIPISIAFAILRSRLWDIDIIINRTLVYSSLTAILALIYFASVIALQSLLSVFTGQLSWGTQTPVVIVASTLGIAALFQPLRRRLQTIIDRRFYRSRYDAARTLAAFSASLRNEVDLNQLREQLLAVVQETMQPAHVSLWLRQPEQSGQRNTRLLPRIDEEESVAP